MSIRFSYDPAGYNKGTIIESVPNGIGGVVRIRHLNNIVGTYTIMGSYTTTNDGKPAVFHGKPDFISYIQLNFEFNELISLLNWIPHTDIHTDIINAAISKINELTLISEQKSILFDYIKSKYV